MSIPFSNASSRLRSAAIALTLLCAAAPASAQYDAVTMEARKNPFILVRLAALSLKTPAEQGEALAGLVEAELSRGRLKDAKKELKRITDPFWRATALFKLAEYNIAKSRTKEALKALGDSIKALGKKRTGIETTALIRRIASSRARLGDGAGAIAVAKRISERMARIETLLEIGLVQKLDKAGKPIKKAVSDKHARGALAEAYNQARAIKDNVAEAARVLLVIGRAQTRIGDTGNAGKTLVRARKMITSGKFAGRDEALAELAAAETKAGEQSRAMVLVRAIGDPERRVRALASVARAIAETNNMDAAVTLFTLAFETAKDIADTGLRRELLTHIVIEQTRAGRLADAFQAAGYIRDTNIQAEALFRMGRILLKSEKLDEALRLTEYIPYIGLRGQILADVALARGKNGDPVAASALLARALEPLRETPLPGRVEITLEKVLDTQIEVGDRNAAPALFDRARGLIASLPDALSRVRLLTLLARAHARSNDKEQAAAIIKSAWRITWNKRNDPDYPRSIVRIVEALISIDEINEGFNAAARISETEPQGEERLSQTPRNRALRYIAVAAARTGRPVLAIRAARKIRDPASRAAALAAVAIGFSQSTTTPVN